MSNAALAAVTIEEVLAWGVRDFVVCTGARNAPVVLPLLDAPPPVKVWRHFDERSAAFFALGLSKRDRRPVAVVTTSGTAVAELFPAVIEAHYSGIPLVLITADRPKRFRSTGAPQAIEQAHLFGAYSEGCFDVEAAEDFPVGFPWNRARPIQINACFEEPTAETPAAIDWEGAVSRSGGGTQPCWVGDSTLLSRFVAEFGGGVVILGEIDAPERPAVENFLERLGAPVWAEAISGLRESSRFPTIGEDVFRRWRPTKVLRIGGVPSLRFWRDLEDRPGIPVLSVTLTGFSGLARPCEVTGWVDFSEIAVSPSGDPPPVSVEAEQIEWGSEMDGISRLSAIIPGEAMVFLGNSLPIREWNQSATSNPAHATVFASRGANGIDGEICTFLGLSEGVEESWGIFGDLTTLYDLNAPWVLDQLSAGRRRIVIVNNGGGRIFSQLAALGGVEKSKKRITENRHRRNFASWAAMWGIEYRSYQGWEFADYLSADGLPDLAVIELIPDEEEREESRGS